MHRTLVATAGMRAVPMIGSNSIRDIGVPLNELLRYGEPDWPLGQHQESGSTSAYDSLDFHDALDKD